ncbi:MAG TPA: multicopper oxidase domain-containing protein, partial [Chthoniobacteraceae bacterium]|nr:multicopper oxidase domain-containing protein [Chthoniobacteraceae bacterium]
MPSSRRQFLRTIATLGGATILGSRLKMLAQNHGGHSNTTPSAISGLEPFVDALRIPPVLKPSKTKKIDSYSIAMQAGSVKCHRDLPATSVLGYNGIYPGPTIVASRNRTVSIKQTNNLPMSHTTGGNGEMVHMLPAVHLHGAEVAPDSDGHPDDGIEYGGGTRDYVYPNQQRGCTLWYHDHTHGQTGERVLKGLAGMYILRDPLVEAPLKLPSGEREIPLIIQDRSFTAEGQFIYTLDAPTLEAGFQGDNILVNGVVQPFLAVETALYRFRILNGSNSRIYRLALSNGDPLIQIGTDGGLLQRPKELASLEIAPSERVDLIIDFTKLPVGSKVVLQNLNGSDSTAEIMRFDVTTRVKEKKKVPQFLQAWEELPESESVMLRNFNLARQTIDGVLTWTINGQAYGPGNAPLATPEVDSIEQWNFVNPTNHPHPMHLHLVQFQVININGVP